MSKVDPVRLLAWIVIFGICLVAGCGILAAVLFNVADRVQQITLESVTDTLP